MYSVACWAVVWKEYARGRRRPVDGVGWMGGGGKMVIVIGEVVVASLGDESTPGLGVAAAALSSLA